MRRAICGMASCNTGKSTLRVGAATVRGTVSTTRRTKKNVIAFDPKVCLANTLFMNGGIGFGVPGKAALVNSRSVSSCGGVSAQITNMRVG